MIPVEHALWEAAREAGAAKGSRAAKARRDELADLREVMPIIRVRREAGGSLHEIADDLNARGFLTVRDFRWNRVQVRRPLRASEN